MQQKNSVPGIDELTQAGIIGSRGKIGPIRAPHTQAMHGWCLLCLLEHVICVPKAKKKKVMQSPALETNTMSTLAAQGAKLPDT